MSAFSRSRRTLAAVAGAAALALALTACGSSSMNMDSHSGTMDSHSPSAMPSMPSMPSMSTMPGMGSATSDGLADAQDGYRLSGLPDTLPAGQGAALRFSITAPDGRPLTDFAVEQTQRLHFYAIRSDLTGFQHLHPTLAGDGSGGWTAQLAAPEAGTWRFYASFTPDSGPGKGRAYVLSRTATVPGPQSEVPLPAPAGSATTPDGYTVTATVPGGRLMAGMAHELTVTVSKDGQPVTDLQPYLETYAHLTAFHAGDQAFAHLHPETTATGERGGPTLTFHAELAEPGDWRLFLQFQTAGQLHTAALTLNAAG
ncbi:hypothetical protein [Kitasatospora azatica]|uniref:hypothetical protein n=1 Tax=Kitasatospora azatica TaxID=58347 RepID=UPI000569EC10|nr:hypothetical protein [Kitasatospora azatica]